MQYSNHYINGYLNCDDEANAVPANQSVRAENLRYGVTGLWESLKGNSVLSNTHLPGDGVNTCIGAASDETNRFLVFFVHNDWNPTPGVYNLHTIYLFDQSTSTFWKVLRSDITADGLNFQVNSLVTARIINGYLYWTDGYNAPRKINIGAAMQIYDPTPPLTAPFTYSVSGSDVLNESITVIKQPPLFIASWSKDVVSFANNYIKDESWQFSFDHEYYDGEISVLGEWSTATKLNTSVDTYNVIKITAITPAGTYPTYEYGVKKLRLWAKRGSDGQVYKIREWSRENPEDDALFTGAYPTFDFYGNIAGETMDAANANRPYDDVPLTSQCLELADNRLFLGNNLRGYDTPVSTSLTAALPAAFDPTDSSYTLTLYRVYHYKNTFTVTYGYSGWYVKDPTGLAAGWYALSGTEQLFDPLPNGSGLIWLPPYYPPHGAAPTTIAQSDLLYKGNSVSAAIIATRPSHITATDNEDFTTTSGTVTWNTINGLNILKSDAAYQLCVTFYDKYLRKCGAITRSAAYLATPKRDYAFTSAYDKINWTLSNTAAADEIPDFAYYYSVGATENQKTRFFVQSIASDTKYVKKDSSGNYVYTPTYSPDIIAVALSIKALVQTGLGYSFAEGDQCTLIVDTIGTFSLSVVGVFGEWIHVRPVMIEASLSHFAVYEIFTPYKSSGEEPFYNRGNLYRVLGPGTVTPTYETTSGHLSADVFAITRSYNSAGFIAEAMCPNDNYYQRWDTDAGRISLVTDKGQRNQKTEVAFSNVYVPGTGTNGLATFEPLNREILSYELGDLTSLTLASKVQGEGKIMLAIGKVRAASIYIGETQLLDAEGNSSLVKTTGIIGQVNPLKGDYGCTNPESIVVYNGNVYWLSVPSKAFVEYSVNGLDEISKGQENQFKFSKFTETLCDYLLSPGTGAETRKFVYGGVDPQHKEILWSLPKLLYPPATNLTDYEELTSSYLDYYTVSTVNHVADPYNTSNLQAKTIVFKRDAGRWMGEFKYRPERYVSLGSTLYSFNTGILTQHDTTNYNPYGRSKIAFVCNADNKVKELRTLSIECSEAPEWVHIRTEYPYEQSTDLIATDFTQKEGVWYADILRDRLTPGAASYDRAQVSGDVMRGQAIKILVQFSNNTTQKWLRLATVGFNISSGHF